MSPNEPPIESILHDLRERAKELACLYRVDEILHLQDSPIEERMRAIVSEVPRGWQYSDDCTARIILGPAVFVADGFEESPWSQEAQIIVEGVTEGKIEVFYTQRKPPADVGPFLEEELRLINAIAERIGHFLGQLRLRSAVESWKTATDERRSKQPSRWRVIVEFLRNADEKLLTRITRRMINHLCWSGFPGGEALLLSVSPPPTMADPESGDENRPSERSTTFGTDRVTEETFDLASLHLSDDEITNCVQRWIREDKTSFLADALEDPATSVSEVADALERHKALALDATGLPPALATALKVSLLRRCFTDHLDFINTAKAFVEVEDFYDLLPRVIYPPGSHGRLGGKSAGIFLAASVIRQAGENAPLLQGVRVPKTWYIASDGILSFIRYNHLEDVYVRKYDKIEHVRQGYPYLIQSFKNSPFPPEIRGRLSLALDDFGEVPIIVRSSSLLEDRTGSSFSGKYKSLFLANQGSRSERLAALEDAIAEVYASTFGPDPIGYRAERGLIDVHEEMGILIQEVVGARVGKYFFPAFAGVAFSNNEFRWSPRIKREDGLVRLVPGLGTRAVDRLSDDYPVLIAPGQPGLRVNASPDEVMRYAPRKIDVIDLEKNRFETMAVDELIREVGVDYPGIRRILSLVDGDQLRKPLGLLPDLDTHRFVVTFDGLTTDTPFLEQIRSLLELLQREMHTPVDIEFASDGETFYLLQCRPQSYADHSAPTPIPRDLPQSDVLFSANRFVSNGRVPDITHIVYVDPRRYGELESLSQLKEVGAIVQKLNKVLPKRQFVLMGPGRWGSRGDIRLGVNVTYSDINNTAALIEIARVSGNYVPDLSFGTHFFQDLVEAGIRYLPLYPDEDGNVFQERFFRASRNLLPELLPEHEHLEATIRVIDVPSLTKGRVLRILMNADLDEAVGVLASPSGGEPPRSSSVAFPEPPPSHDHWRWRNRMAERLAAELAPEESGVVAVYLIGSTKNGTAGPGSDIDIILHFRGSEQQRASVSRWLSGWSQCLAEINYLRTGYKSSGLLDVHWVSDRDIEDRNSFAVKIDAITDRAQRLPMNGEGDG
ncbi:MAG: nucleotidyltransferase domain-containing protein [Candidatus Eisenbacteria bacterium]|uniref:Phosphoenolpyruvate synthase n=1 Tax=Eiseniibacteriota bacterium TaxID=2212470 RepID=A0A956SDV0_UNCEI|nr:nucleotidyltransferase domain-containing protein [Candidatus Eisenbacteria bacterium]